MTCKNFVAMRIAKIKHRLTLSRGPLQVINLDASLSQMGLFIPARTEVKKKIAFLKCEMNFGRI